MRIGYARVSTADQNMHLQQDALEKAGCERVFLAQWLLPTALGDERAMALVSGLLDEMRTRKIVLPALSTLKHCRQHAGRSPKRGHSKL